MKTHEHYLARGFTSGYTPENYHDLWMSYMSDDEEQRPTRHKLMLALIDYHYALLRAEAEVDRLKLRVEELTELAYHE